MTDRIITGVASLWITVELHFLPTATIPPRAPSEKSLQSSAWPDAGMEAEHQLITLTIPGDF